LQNIAVIRLIEGRLAWFPPGTSEEPLWLDQASARENLRAVVMQRRMNVGFALPASDVRLLPVTISADEKKHVASSLPFMLEEQVAADIEDLHFAHTAGDQDTLSVGIVATSRMESWQALVAEFPGISQWIPEPLLLPWQEGEWCLVLEAQGAIARIGRCEGFGIEREMLSTMLECAAQEGEPPQAVIIYGSDQAADTALVPETLRDSVQWRRGNLYSALLLNDKEEKPLNMLQGAFAPRLPLKRWWRQWRAVAAVFAVGLAVQLIATYAEYRGLRSENLALRSAVEASYRTAYPRGSAPDPEKQLRRQLDALRGSAQSSGFISLMERVGSVIASRPGTSIATINYNDKADEMRMNIVAANYEAVEQVRADINKAGLQAVMESSSAQGNKVRARLRVGDG